MKRQVSIIIPTYKRPNGLKRAINSSLEQTYKNIEIIVVDDNNPNTKNRKETELVMKDYKKYPNIKYLQHSENMNGSVARNTGIKEAQGHFIAFLDNDDEFIKNKIELQVKSLEGLGESYGISYTKFIRKKNDKLIEKGIESRTGNLTAEILKGTFYISAGSNILVRKDIVDQLNGFNESFLRRQDLEFLIRASMLTKIAHVNKNCLIIHRDDRSNSKLLSKQQLKVNTEKYIEVFSEYIDRLPENEKKKVLISQDLLNLRSYIAKGKLLSIKKIADEKNIKYTVILKYIVYLVKRKIFKQCYGFVF